MPMWLTFGSECWEEYDVADGAGVGQEHDEPVDADTQPTGGREPVFEGSEVVIVDDHGFVVSGFLLDDLVFESGPLLSGVDELAEGVAEFSPGNDALEPLGVPGKFSVIS